MEEEITPEIVNSDKEMVTNGKTEVLRDEKGRFVQGHPQSGRPVGTLNRFSQMKNDLLEAWKTSKGKKRFLEMLNSQDKEDFKWAVERIINILPKEHLIDVEDNTGPKVVIVFADKNNAATGLQAQGNSIQAEGQNEKV